MNEIEKYRILSAGKAFGHRAQIALLLLDSSTAYKELKEEAAQTSLAGSYGCAGGFPSEIFEKPSEIKHSFVVVLIRWLQSTFIPFITAQNAGGMKLSARINLN